MLYLTVITINRNNFKGLSYTLKSVFSQSVADFEYIVIDGASSDDSISLIQSFQKNKQPDFKWLSEPDAGIYDAMNKAIKMATGDYLLFINSGDVLYDNSVIEKAINQISNNNDFVSGILQLNDNEQTIKLKPPKELSLYQAVYNHLLHPCTFIKRSLFEKYGYYNIDNKIVSDWEFFLIASGLNSCSYQTLDFVVSEFYTDGISSKNSELVNIETENVLNRLIPDSIQKDLRRLNHLEIENNRPEIKIIKSNTSIRKMLLFFYKLISKTKRK